MNGDFQSKLLGSKIKTSLGNKVREVRVTLDHHVTVDCRDFDIRYDGSTCQLVIKGRTYCDGTLSGEVVMLDERLVEEALLMMSKLRSCMESVKDHTRILDHICTSS